MPRTRRSDPGRPGIVRLRRGRGFAYADPDGRALRDPEDLARIRALAIPPAWTEVWICPDPLGHLQAVGTDAAGRKQYRYHDRWRARRDQEKFDRMMAFARTLPRLRAITARDLAREGFPRERVLACAARLLDRGFFRIGGEAYAEQNRSYGLATMRKEHVSTDGDVVGFEYPAKSGRERVQRVVDPEVAEVVRALKRRRGGSPELLAYRGDDGRWVDVRSSDINDYVKAATGDDHSSKDFRTWHATVLCAVALAVSAPALSSRTARTRAMTRAVKEVAHHLGNTPAVCRASYIDPRVFDRFRAGVTIGGALERIGAEDAFDRPGHQGAVERAVIDLIEENVDSPLVERVA